MKRRLAKLTIREIIKSFNRFIAIFLIVALGTGFLAGLLATTPDMRHAIDSFYGETDFMDLRLVSTFGFDDDDVAAVRAADGVTGVSAVYSKDLAVSMNGEKWVARIESLPENLSSDNADYINRLTLVTGRLPEQSGECVVQIHGFPTPDIELGCTVAVSGEKDTFGVDELTLTVVGTVRSPRYFSLEGETTTVGSGKVGLFVYTTEDVFSLEVKTDLFITLSSAAAETATTDGYFSAVDAFVEKLKPVAETRIDARYDAYIEQLTKAVADGRAELESKRNETENAFEDVEAEFSLATKKLDGVSAQLKSARNELNSKYADYNALISGVQNAYETAKAAKESRLNEIAAEIEALNESSSTYDTDLASLTSESETIRLELLAMRENYEHSVAAYEPMRLQLVDADKKLTSQEKQYASSVKDLNDRYAEFQQSKLDAEAEFEKAEAEISDLEASIDGLNAPEWYYLGRDKSISAASYTSNVEKINAIAKVFPVFFFFIAAFVALTTMTRMVDEQRGQIGALKSLGYSDAAVTMKYLAYAGIATLGGSVFGLAIGFKLFPTVIWNAYGMMYELPPFHAFFEPLLAILAFAAISVCTLGATLIACHSVIRSVPATLFRPKAPVPGKRVFLERIGFLWKHIGFNNKITLRNLFRYKKRLVMTVLGVAGCTALLLTGFGLKDAIGTIVDRQFKEIYRYNLTVGLEKRSDGGDAAFNSAAKMLTEHGVYKFIRLSVQSGTATVEGGRVIDISINVPVKADDLKYFITMRDRQSKEAVEFTDGSVVICEKLAEQLNISKGASITVENADGKTANLTVTGLTENYVSYLMYVAPDVYETAFGTALSYDGVIAAAYGESTLRDSLAEDLHNSGSVTSATYYDEIAGSFSESMKSIDSIVMVLIVSAGLLSFVVLYNLININITERRKEIATLKVLGFRGSETFSYIAKETMFLSVLGTALGLFLGIFLHRFVVLTAEVDVVMFNRSISAASFVLSALLSVLFALAVNMIMYPKLRRIDMVESLKAGE